MKRARERVGDVRAYLVEALNGGKSVREIAQELGVSEKAVYYWRMKFGIKPEFR